MRYHLCSFLHVYIKNNVKKSRRNKNVLKCVIGETALDYVKHDCADIKWLSCADLVKHPIYKNYEFDVTSDDVCFSCRC